MTQDASASASIPGYLIVGGYGEVGAHLARLLRARRPRAPLILGGRRPSSGHQLAASLGNTECAKIDTSDARPLRGLRQPLAAVITAVNDPEDHVLLDAVERGVPVLDIARWTSRVSQSSDRLAEITLRAPVVFGSAWMAGLVSVVSRVAATFTGAPETIDIDILYALADRSGPNSIEYMDRLSVPFVVRQGGNHRIVRPLTSGHLAPFSGAKPVRTYRIDTPEQASLPVLTGAHSVSTRIAFDSRSATLGLVTLKRLGIWRLLQHRWFTRLRRALLRSSGTGGEARFLVRVTGERGQRAIEIRDPQGQAHLTALGAVAALEAIESEGSRQAAIVYPEQFPEPLAILQWLRAHGVGVGIS